MNLFRDIAQFHRKFFLPPVAPVPSQLPVDMAEFRAKFMQEEVDEYKKAVAEGDLEGQLDALVDLVYVAMGTAYLQGLPFNCAWDRVQAANMAKIRAVRESDSKRGSLYDVVKPEGWTPPRHLDLIDPITGPHRFLADLADSR